MRTLFFDLDGTLIDSAVGITRCVAYSLERMGHPGLPQQTLRGWIGPALRVSYAALFDSAADIERAVDLYRERFEAEGWREHAIYDGIGDAVEAAHAAGYRLAVVTAKNEPHARRIVGTLPFGHRFEDIIGATPDGRLSHKPELIAEALARLALPPERCTMIGDRHLDIEGAMHHGMRGIGVLWGFGSEDELREAGAYALVRTPQALSALLLDA
ncbi:MAG: HAD hydrolase-like protein [Lysobacter sp.]|nr:HAD hydrolase-like protein [Lysobacter sp.]